MIVSKKSILWILLLLFLNFCQKNSGDEVTELAEEIPAEDQNMPFQNSEGNSREESVEYYELFRLNHRGKLEYKNPIDDIEFFQKKTHSRIYYSNSNGDTPNHKRNSIKTKKNKASQKKLLREEHYDENGQLLHYSKFQYQGDRITEQRGFDASHNPIYHRFYGENQELVKEDILEWEEISESILYFYDSDGYKNKEEHYDPLGQLTFYSIFLYQDPSSSSGSSGLEEDLRNEENSDKKTDTETQKNVEKKLLKILFYNPEGKHLSTFTEDQHF